jgi:hypothetical protein
MYVVRAGAETDDFVGLRGDPVDADFRARA